MNNEKFTLKSPEDMPEHAKEIVNKIEQLKQLYLKGENFNIDDQKLKLVQDLFSKKFYKNVMRFCGFGSHLVEQEITFLVEIDEKAIENVTELSKYLENKGTQFLFMQIPCKLSPNIVLPDGILDRTNPASTKFVEGLKKNNVNTFDYRQYMLDNNIDFLDSFFVTDCHWKPKTAFDATKILCQEIEKLISIEIDTDKLDINNYDRIVYPNIFLGSCGKSSNIYFSGVEDFELIIPKYDTDYSWIDPVKGFTKRGEAKASLLYPLHLDWNYTVLNPYAVYSLPMSGYAIIKNHKATNTNKILFLCDSFSNTIASFLAPQFSELHFLDLRGEKKDLFGIIEEIKPDIVVMLYTTYTYNNIISMTDVNPNQ